MPNDVGGYIVAAEKGHNSTFWKRYWNLAEDIWTNMDYIKCGEFSENGTT